VLLTEFTNNTGLKSDIPASIKNKINIRKRLLTKFKRQRTLELKGKINVLDKKIRVFFCNAKWKRVGQAIVHGNSGSLWKAVKVANDMNHNQLPNVLFLTSVKITRSDISEVFAKHFDTKIKQTLETVNLNDLVYNGTKKITTENLNFMTKEGIKEYMVSLK
jgi:hypothetical protein